MSLKEKSPHFEHGKINIQIKMFFYNTIEWGYRHGLITLHNAPRTLSPMRNCGKKVPAVFLVILALIMIVGFSTAQEPIFSMMDLSGSMDASSVSNPFDRPGYDFHWIVPGEHSYAIGNRTIPFHIVDPIQNNGRNIVITNGGINGDPAFYYPTSFEFTVPQGFPYTVTKVHILGMGASWADPPHASSGEVAGVLTFIYTDNSSVTQPLKRGYEFDDWSSPHDAVNTVYADSGLDSKGRYAHVDILSITLPERDGAKLSRIQFRDSGTITAIPIFAITLESNPEETKPVPFSMPSAAKNGADTTGLFLVAAAGALLCGFIGYRVAGFFRQKEQTPAPENSSLSGSGAALLAEIIVLLILAGFLFLMWTRFAA